MSIWSSIDQEGERVMALNGDDEAAHYRGEGEPTISIDVATTFHDHIRLSLQDDKSIDLWALLSPESARLLRDRLDKALVVIERRRDRP